jgi:hypothetical protein
MNQEQINSKFANFLGWKKLNDGRYHFSFHEDAPTVKCPPVQLQFHQYWNWMMRVVEKIEALPYHPFHGRFGVYISSNSCTIQGTKLRLDPDNPNYAYHSEHHGDSKIEATWMACSCFLDWYDELKNPGNSEVNNNKNQ